MNDDSVVRVGAAEILAAVRKVGDQVTALTSMLTLLDASIARIEAAAGIGGSGSYHTAGRGSDSVRLLERWWQLDSTSEKREEQ